MLKQKMVIW